MWRSRLSTAVTIVILAAGCPCLCGQGLEDLKIVDSPTAGILPHGAYMFEGSVGPGNGLLFGVEIGFHDRLMLGVSYGVQEFIGRGDIEANDRPGFQARFRLIEEGFAGPAFALGVDTQGEDMFIENDERYERKSKGIYAVLSKNYFMLRNFALHGGINHSFERKYENGINFFGGITLEALTGMTLLLDYNAALDDDDTELPSCRTKGRGYLDSGVQFTYRENLRIRLLFKDLLGNYTPKRGVARTLEIFYIGYF